MSPLAAALALLVVQGVADRPEPPAPANGILPPAPAEIFVLTMGPDHTVLFREWGHAALCVDRICFNYGFTDFSRPVALTWEVLNGKARFWLGLTTYEETLALYASHRRSVIRQDLPLDDESREALVGRLAGDLVPGQSEYTYNHFTENCTTRLRDYLDGVTDGALSRVRDLPERFRDAGGAPTFRSQIRRGLESRPFLLWVSDVAVGSAADGSITPFQAMFVPEGLRHGLERSLSATPVRLRDGRDGDFMAPDPGSRPYLPGLFGIAALLALPMLLPRTRRLGNLARMTTGLVLGAIGVAGTAAVLVSPLPEFHTSALPLVVLPTDVLLASRFAPRYALPRIAFGAVALAACLMGAWTQPLAWTALAVLIPIGAIARASRRVPATA